MFFFYFPRNNYFPSKNFPFPLFMTSFSFGISHLLNYFLYPYPYAHFWEVLPPKQKGVGETMNGIIESKSSSILTNDHKIEPYSTIF